MTDQAITTTIAAFFGFLTTITTSVAAYYMLRLKQQQDASVIEVSKVKTTLETTTAVASTKLSAIAVVADATHKLVNSSMSIQLRIASVALRRVADITKDTHDEEIAAEAEAQYAIHEAQQSVVDAQHPLGIPAASHPEP